MQIDVDVNAADLKSVSDFLLALPREINLAKTRTLRKEVKWVATQLQRKLAEENDMPVSVFKRSAKSSRGFRVRTNTIRNGDTFGQVWSGLNRVKAGYIGKPRQVKKGAWAGRRRFYKGAFVATLKSGHVGIFERAGSGRLPIEEISERIKSVSAEDIEKQIPGRLIKTMDSELNYILNVAKKR